MKQHISLPNKSIVTRILSRAGIVTLAVFAIVIAVAAVDVYKSLRKGYSANYWLDVQYNASVLSSNAQKIEDKLSDLSVEFFQNSKNVEGGFDGIAHNLIIDNPNITKVYLIYHGDSSKKRDFSYTWSQDPDSPRGITRFNYVKGKALERYSDVSPETSTTDLDHIYEGLVKTEGEKVYSVQLTPLIEEGQFVGMVGFEIVEDLSLLPLFLHKNYATADYFLLASDGILIYSSLDAKIAGGNIESIQGYQPLKSFLKYYSKTESLGDGSIIRDFKDDKTGEKYLYAVGEVVGQDYFYIVRVANTELFAPVRWLLYKLISIGVLGVLFTVLLLYWVVKSMTNPVKDAVAIVKKVAAGDLSQRIEVDGSDEVAELLKAIDMMSFNLGILIGKIKNSSTMLSEAAINLQDTSSIQKQSVSHFEKLTQDVASRATNINNNAVELAGTMSGVAKVASDTAVYAGRGREHMQEVGVSMGKLKQSIDAITANLSLFQERVSSIATVSSTISNVAGQTNLLSLNASIEAEKAGEAGSGFSVVAHEIRSLADQTAVATKDIDYIVKEVEEGVRDSVGMMTAFTDGVKKSLKEVAELNSGFVNIIGKVENLEREYSKVNNGMYEQSEEAQAINNAMEDLKESASKAADAISDLDDMTGHMSESSKDLKSSITPFKLSDNNDEGLDEGK